MIIIYSTPIGRHHSEMRRDFLGRGLVNVKIANYFILYLQNYEWDYIYFCFMLLILDSAFEPETIDDVMLDGLVMVRCSKALFLILYSLC